MPGSVAHSLRDNTRLLGVACSVTFHCSLGRKFRIIIVCVAADRVIYDKVVPVDDRRPVLTQKEISSPDSKREIM